MQESNIKTRYMYINRFIVFISAEPWKESDDFFKTMFITRSDDTEVPTAPDVQDTDSSDCDGYSAGEFYVILDKPYQYYPDDDLDTFVNCETYRLYSQLRDKCSTTEFQDFDLLKNSSKEIRLVQLYDAEVPKVKISVTVKSDFKVQIVCQDKLIPPSHDIWSDIPRECYNVDSLMKILKTFRDFTICLGNCDPKLQDLVPLGVYLDVAGGPNYQGYRECYTNSTIRSTGCPLLMRGSKGRCDSCVHYRKILNNRHCLKQKKEQTPTPQKNWLKSKTPNNRLTETQKFYKLKQLRQYSNSLENEVERLSRKIKTEIRTNGVPLSESESDDMVKLMEDMDSEIKNSYPDECAYQRLFWEQQMKYNAKSDKRGMRWHPMFIKWCIFLKSKSSQTYDVLRNSGFINLPSERILRDYTHVVKKGTGFNTDIVDMLHKEVYRDGEDPLPHQKIVGIVQDEIRIKSDLVYDKHSGELIGFVDLGGIGNSFLNIDECLKKEAKAVAKYVLVIMVRGISTKLKFPFAHFATCGVTSDQLFSVLWQAVEILETDLGLTVLFITSDGASPNRRFINLHRQDGQQGVVYRADNIFAPEPRFIYFISDPPHLLKTARNCFSNSYCHKKSRKLWKDNKDISWLHIVNLYKDHCTGLYKRCNKLTRAHINLTPFGCMKVNLAAQVLSSTVADAVEMLYGENTAETVKFIRHMNKFFDCMNVHSLSEAPRKRNENVKPYTSVDDPRIEYLTNEFLKYFDDWKQSVENRRGEFTKTEMSGMQLSYQTLQGLEITVKSVVACVKYCLNSGMEFVLTERFNQDPLEQHFGIQRTSGGCNNNPNLQQFNNNMVQIRTVGSQAIAPIRGNTKRSLNLAPIDDTPLQKRRRNTV